MSWKTVALGEVCKVIAGQSPEGKYYNNDGNGLPFYQGKKDFGSVFIKPPSVWTTNVTKEATKDDILMSVRAPVGPVNISTENICIGRGLAAIRATEKIDKSYLFNFLKSIERDLVGSSGAVFNSINKGQIESLQVPLPSVQLQQKIVAKLDAIFFEVDKATAATKANAKNTEALFQSYLKQVFGLGGEDWDVYTIKDLIKIRSGDFLPAKNMKIEGSIDVYGGNGISGKHNLHNLSGDNIIIGRVGAKCGNVRLVSGDIWVTDNAFYVSEYKKNIDKEFLSVALEHKNLRTLANQMAQPVISFTTIKDAELKIPNSLEKQVEFLKIKNYLEIQTKIVNDSSIKKVHLLNLFKQSILKQAFNGELVKE